MNATLRLITIVALVIGVALPSWPARGRASHEALSLYEDWSAATIRSDRWSTSSDPAQEIRRAVKEDQLLMRFRREGATSSDSGSTGFFSNRLHFLNPTVVDAVEAEFRVRDFVVTGCPMNPTTSNSRVIRIDQLKFSDLDPAVIRLPGDRTGDYIARVHAFRMSNSTDPDGALQVTANLFRCNNPPCSATTTIAGPFALGQVASKKWFRMRLTWDASASQFRAGFNDCPDALLPYSPSANIRSGNGPFVLIGIQHLPANCTVTSGGPTVGDAEVAVGKVWTNAAAVMP